ncbi:hypothetical protein [Rubidibacter lacunae]|uniref:hypothetical protein n=1 Tax=Rubidibacter lacunae TaxID=582514 RepID=UPI0004042439|nr:hypothetical protein [Rubidibacter lacunae]
MALESAGNAICDDVYTPTQSDNTQSNEIGGREIARAIGRSRVQFRLSRAKAG